MCSVCLKNPCDARCPNAPDPTPLYVCDRCGYGIFKGEEFYDGADGYICEECMNGMSTKELMEMFGEEMRIA